MNITGNLTMSSLAAAKTTAHREQGFTLIEVLIAVVLLAIGLLSMAQMQANGLRSTHSAYLRSQATILTGDILDSMRANYGGTSGPVLNDAYTTAFTDGLTSGTSIAAQDLDQWKTNLDNLLPNGEGRITRAGNTISVSVRWTDNRQHETAQPFRIFQVDTTL